ncbi:MAG: PAS domain S-box protein [Nitrospinae bacterium]|nr:PAS domain S-box protein [Nitrospinota bacterium]
MVFSRLTDRFLRFLENRKSAFFLPSPLRLALYVLITIFFIEMVLMQWVLPLMDLPPVVNGIVDTLLLTALLMPAIYFFVYRPFELAREIAVGEAEKAGAEKKAREMADQLRQSEERFKLIAENISEVFWMADVPLEKIYYVSPGYERVWTLSRNSLYENPRSFLEAIHPEDRERVLHDFEKQKEGRPYDHHFRIVLPDGTGRWIWNRGFPVSGNEGAVTRYVGIAEDVTARKTAEEALRASEEQFRSLVDNIGIGVSLISPKMEILSMNRKMREWFPVVDPSERPICYKSFNTPPREGICVYCPTYLTLVDGQVHESITETPVGDQIVNYLVRSSPIKDKNGNVSAAVEMVEDVTVKKRGEDRLKNLNMELAKALDDLKRAQTLVLRSEKLASIGTLSAGVAHEILNPLNIMGTIIQLLLMDDLPPENKEQLEEVMRQVRRATKITDNLRMFAHQHREEITLVNAHNLFDQTAILLEHDLNLDNIVIERHYAKDFPAIYADEDKLAQVFLNLLTNARDALRAKNGGIIVVSTARVGDEALITVADNGTGIPPEVIEKVFDPFFTTKDPGKGTGLGLSMAHSIIESHNGTIEVSSEPGKGAAFTIRLPVERRASAVASAK